MMRKWLLVASAVALATPVLAGAQEQPAPAPRARRADRLPRPEARAFTFSFNGNRARIGVLVNTEGNAETDKIGAKIDGVTPGGPADHAGLKAGDIITRFNGTSLAGASSDDDEDSGPGNKLIELVGRVDPGDSVKVDYRRGTEAKTATIVADEGENGRSYSWAGPGEGPFAVAPKVFGGMGDGPMVMMEGARSLECAVNAWCELDLVTLNPDLGEYFGARDGVLVVRAAADSALPLRGGDVILSIGGRKPTSPEHAMRILRSYDVGETVTIDIMRKQHRQSVTWTVPEESERGNMLMPKMRTRVRPHGEPSGWRLLPNIAPGMVMGGRRAV